MRLFKIVLSLAVFLLALPSVAEEIVYFKSGQSMPIRSHEIVDGMVHMDLGEDSMVAFPEFAIERIEIAGKEVMLKPSYGTVSNRRVPTTRGSYPSQNTRRPQDFEVIPVNNSQASPIKTNKRTGLAEYRPRGNSPAANRRRMAVTGNTQAFGNNPTRRGDGQTFAGTTQMGGRHVIGRVTPPRTGTGPNSRAPQLVPVTMRPRSGNSAAGTPSPAPSENDSDNR